MANYYFSLQYSAIQKTVLRHDRLWSIAGISNILSRMNEIEMPAIAINYGGKAIVAGGGKFTARFTAAAEAEKAKNECVKLIATTLPMLEFQVSEIHAGESFKTIVDSDQRNRLISELGDRKRQFRGYGVSFNPQLQLCAECGEYPVQNKIRRKEKSTDVCRVCKSVFEESRCIVNDKTAETTLQKVYHRYWKEVPTACGKEVATDFNDLFPGNDGKRKRMAVWFSDLNNMNDKVPVWLSQDDENKVLDTFNHFRETVIDIIVKALTMTFPDPSGESLPFRLVVVGGDDLCLVMAEKHILNFTRNISTALNQIKQTLAPDHPLSDSWLYKHGKFEGKTPKPFGFGASFVVTGIHTPFSQIHRVGEELMSAAKKGTDRRGNSVNWRIMAEENSATEKHLQFERPLFIEDDDVGKNDSAALSFNEYLKLRREMKGVSGSHRQQIIGVMQQEENRNPWVLERELKLLDAGEKDKSFTPLLCDKRFRDSAEMLLPDRIATLFELMSIGGGDQ